ncbi:MAG TPA: hypothetical protein VHM91_08910, partial [Verrucomicrobiales bacterium]|nr:hypothetical protein [Verrucomicrobiales bacterium]
RVPGSLKPDRLTQTVPRKVTTDPWGVIQWMIDTPNQSLNLLGVGFKLEASPSFPTTWPTRAMFGLPE